jgi:hypothetical protein
LVQFGIGAFPAIGISSLPMVRLYNSSFWDQAVIIGGGNSFFSLSRIIAGPYDYRQVREGATDFMH